MVDRFSKKKERLTVTVTHNDKSTKPSLENLGIVNDLINISTKKHFYKFRSLFLYNLLKKKIESHIFNT